MQWETVRMHKKWNWVETADWTIFECIPQALQIINKEWNPERFIGWPPSYVYRGETPRKHGRIKRYGTYKLNSKMADINPIISIIAFQCEWIKHSHQYFVVLADDCAPFHRILVTSVWVLGCSPEPVAVARILSHVRLNPGALTDYLTELEQSTIRWSYPRAAGWTHETL